MTRVAFKMRLKPGCEAEYKARHDAIWPELVEFIRQCGVRNYSIFRLDLDLFAYLEMDDTSPTRLSTEEVAPIQQRWWEMMEPLMECNDDASPVVWPMEEMFHQD